MWTFGVPDDVARVYSDGTRIPARRWVVFRNGAPVGEVDVHCHRRAGPDGVSDLSVGVTMVAFGALAERERADSW